MRDNAQELFRLPNGYARFAIIGDSPTRDAEWGIPAEPAKVDKRAEYYRIEDALNVIQCVLEVADALREDSDCVPYARRAFKWANEQRAIMRKRTDVSFTPDPQGGS